jgi:hypothetical protein
MTFDITLAIAEISCKNHEPDLDTLRARYPELGFVFDLLEDKVEEADGAAIKHLEEMREREGDHEEEVDQLEARINDLRIGLHEIRELTADAEIHQIVEELL